MEPPPPPMLARLERALPVGDYLYEPKWDGLRCLAVVERGAVELWSRHGRTIGRYFPEVLAALRGLGRDAILDGELLARGRDGFDFGAVLERFHPAARRVDELSRKTPALLVAFDLLALDGRGLLDQPFAARREALAALVGAARPALALTPATDDAAEAGRWLAARPGAGIDGVVAKGRGLPYQPGRRAMVKVKREATCDCVVAGLRLLETRGVYGVSSLLLGLWDGPSLRHVGVCTAFPRPTRLALLAELRPLVVPLAGHPWEHGFGLEPHPMGRLPGAAARWVPGEMTLDWVPLRPARVAEVAYGQVDARRFRHAARFLRWRPDRDPRSCTLAQLGSAA